MDDADVNILQHRLDILKRENSLEKFAKTLH